MDVQDGEQEQQIDRGSKLSRITVRLRLNDSSTEFLRRS